MEGSLPTSLVSQAVLSAGYFHSNCTGLLVAPGSDVNRPALLTLLSPPCLPALALTLPPTLHILLILAQTSLT